MSIFRGDGGDTAWLDTMNLALASPEREEVARFETPRQPLIFVVGAPRSGTTLLTQLLVTCYEIGYINNLAARFWNAPYLGLRLARTLAGDGTPEAGLHSDYGTAPGYEGPHEFGHFWQRWFDYGETHNLSQDRLARVDCGYLRQELAAIESVFQRPTLYKNLAACGMNLAFLARLLPSALFIHLRRDSLRVACSLLAARLKNNGNRQAWYSVRPPAYPQLKDLPWAEQIAGQIESVEQHLEQARASLPPGRWLEIDYVDLLDGPAGVLERIAGLVETSGGVAGRRPVPVPELSEPSPPALPTEDVACLRRACAQRGSWPIRQTVR